MRVGAPAGDDRAIETGDTLNGIVEGILERVVQRRGRHRGELAHSVGRRLIGAERILLDVQHHFTRFVDDSGGVTRTLARGCDGGKHEIDDPEEHAGKCEVADQTHEW